MRNLTLPDIELSTIYSTCIGGFTDEIKRERLEVCLKYILSREKTYLKLKGENLLYTLIDDICTEHDITKNELKSVYKEKFSAQGSPGRDIYMSIRKLSPRKICPLCGQRLVSTLDHYLAQTHYPSLVVAPINLVPSCTDCNKIKLSKKALNHLEETFHPYFDNLGDERFLFMDIEENVELSLNFHIQKPSIWDEKLYIRMTNHFNTLDLNDLYLSNAISEIIGNLDSWIKLEPLDLKSQLIDSANSKMRIDKNCWQVALYEGLANSEWFCNVDLNTLIENN